MFLLKALIIASLVKILVSTNSPALCAGIYTTCSFVLGLLSGGSFFFLLIGSVFAFGLAYLYFWLLDRFEDSALFWVVFILGLVIGLV